MVAYSFLTVNFGFVSEADIWPGVCRAPLTGGRRSLRDGMSAESASPDRR